MSYRAVLDGTVLAESAEVETVEGNAYFPPASVNWDLLTENTRTSVCPWKGEANYYDARVGDDAHESVGWTYHTPSEAAANIGDHVAFWGAVSVEQID